MTDPGRHGRNFVWLLGAEIGQRLFSLVLFIYLNHRLSVEQNGWYGLFVAVFPLLVIASNWGLADIVTREVAKSPACARSISRRAVQLQLALFPLVFAGVAAIAWLMPIPDPVPPLLMIGAIAAVFLAMSRVNFGLFAAHDRFFPTSAIVVTVRALIVAVSIALLESGRGVYALVALIVPAYAVQWAAGFYLSRAYRSAETPYNAPLLREGTPIALGGLAATAFIALDLPLFYALGDASEAGIYALAVRLYMTLVVLPEIIGTIAYPLFSRNTTASTSQQAATLSRGVKTGWLLVAPVAVGLTLCGAPVLRVIADPVYASAAPAIAVLAWVLVIESMSYVAVVFLRAHSRQHIPLIVFTIANVLKIAAALVFIPRLGTAAFLAINLVLAALIALTLGWQCRRALRGVAVRRGLGAAFRSVAAILLFAIALWPVRDAHLAIIAAVAAPAYALALLICRPLDSHDWAMLRGILRKRGA